MNLVFCFDERVLMPAEVSIASALWSSRKTDISVFVLTTALSKAAEDELARLCSLFGARSFRVVRTDLSRFSGIVSTNRHIPLETYLNFLIPSAFPGLDKALYLDADVLVRSDLSELWDADMEGKVCLGSDKGWAHELAYCGQLGLSSDDIYINNGVMVLDLKAFREQGLEEMLIAKATACGGRLPSMDQDVLNIVLRGQIGTFDALWNFTSYEYQMDRRNQRNAHVLHYTAVPKPWQGAGGWRARQWRMAAFRVRVALRGGNPFSWVTLLEARVWSLWRCRRRKRLDSSPTA